VRKTTRLLPLLLVFLTLPAGRASAQEESAAFAPVGRLLQSHCAMPGCHAGPDASQGLRLEAAQIYRTGVNVRARTDPRYLRPTRRTAAACVPTTAAARLTSAGRTTTSTRSGMWVAAP
jgi:hypothetical protein